MARALTPRTRLIILSSPHNPTGVRVDRAALTAIGRLAASAGAHVLVDEVYLDAAEATAGPAARLGDVFVSTSSLTKSYGLAGLRCGWSLSAPALAERIRRARDVIDGNGSIAADRLATLAFAQLDRLSNRASSLLSANRALVGEFFSDRPALDVLLPAGGTVAFPRLRGVRDTSAFAERVMAKWETAIVPGRFFEAPEHFRLGFGGPTDTVRGGLARLSEALGRQRADD